MGFQVSPGVQVKEIDLTNVIPAVSTSIGAIAGAFQWGPVGEIITVGSEKGLVDWFGEPNDDTFHTFMPAASFLKYGESLRVVRAATSNLNATNGTAGLLVKNDDHYTEVTIPATTNWVAKYPGVLGNGLKVAMVGADATAWGIWTTAGYNKLFDSAPNTSDYVDSKSGSADEMHVIVFDSTGDWTGQKDTVLETFAFLSQAKDAKGSDGTGNYYVDVINKQSDYIRFGNKEATLTKAGTTATGTTFIWPSAGIADRTLVNGTDDNSPTQGELWSAYELFEDTETIDVNLIIGGPGAVNTVSGSKDHANKMITIARNRMDCVSFVSPRVEETVNNSTAMTDLLEWANGAGTVTGITSSSYAVIDSTALYVYDKYNDVYRWIVAGGAMAGLCAYTDDVTDPWFSPAGFNRGQLLGVTRLAFNPKKFERDELYKARINPICSFPGEGTVLFGDKTAQAKPSAFDRINVRRLFIVLEKAIATAAKYQLFEFNDEFTRAQFRNMVEPFLRDVKGRRGIYDFAVVCDETNNTGQVIDTNRFIADIYIKPARSINFMTLNFIATRTGVEFSEIIGK
jgi:phage tail sheath protein FI